MSGAGRGASANPPKFGGFSGGRRMRRTKITGGDYPPRTFASASRGDFRAIRGERVRRRPRPPGPRSRSPESAQGANSPNAPPRQETGENNRLQGDRGRGFLSARRNFAKPAWRPRRNRGHARFPRRTWKIPVLVYNFHFAKSLPERKF